MHDLDIIKINKYLVAKNLLTNITKTNEHSNITTFVHALKSTKELKGTKEYKLSCFKFKIILYSFVAMWPLVTYSN